MYCGVSLRDSVRDCAIGGVQYPVLVSNHARFGKDT